MHQKKPTPATTPKPSLNPDDDWDYLRQDGNYCSVVQSYTSQVLCTPTLWLTLILVLVKSCLNVKQIRYNQSQAFPQKVNFSF